MSTSAISSSSIFQELQSFYQNRQADLKQLASALKNGDLAGAQQAFQALAVLGEGGPFANSEPFGKTSRADAFNALGEALQAGDLSRAQTAFATLTGRPNNSSVAATPATVVNLAGAQHNIEPLTQNSIYQQLKAYRQQRQADIAQLGQDLQAGDLNAAQQDFAALSALSQNGPNKNGQPFQRADRAQDFQAIGQALQSSDLAGAQSSFASLETTFGKQNHQAQTAISAYNSGATEIVINIAPPPGNTGHGLNTIPPIEPPVIQGPPEEPPVSRPPSNTAGAAGAEIVINLNGASGTTPSAGSAAPEIVINLGQQSGSSSNSSEEVLINFGSKTSGAAVSIDATQGKTGNSEQVTINLGNGSGPSSNSPEEVQINFGSGSSGATVSIAATQGKTGNSEQIAINLQQQQNIELIVNLFASSSGNQTQTSPAYALSVSA